MNDLIINTAHHARRDCDMADTPSTNDQPVKVGLGRHVLFYQDGDHKSDCPIEFDGRRLQIYTHWIQHWQPPYENEPIAPEKRAEIIRSIEAYLQKTREPYTIHDSSE